MGEAKVKVVCEHPGIEFDCVANRLEGTDVVIVSLAARCKSCAKRFVFVGDYAEEPSIEAPSVNSDKRMVLLPMQPDAKPALIIGVN